MFYNVRLLSDLSYEALRSYPVRRSGYAEHLLRMHGAERVFGATAFFLEGTAQRLQMMEELLVLSYVVQNAGGEALVQNTDELVKVPRVHDTAPQPSRGDRQDDSSDLLAQAVLLPQPLGSSASTSWRTRASVQPFKWRSSFVRWPSSNNSMDSCELVPSVLARQSDSPHQLSRGVAKAPSSFASCRRTPRLLASGPGASYVLTGGFCGGLLRCPRSRGGGLT